MSNIAIRNLVKRYGAIQVLHGIDIEMQPGQFTVLVGPSGCGKSTTLRMIAGLESVSSGEIVIGDRVVNDLRPKDRGIAMVFQNYALYPAKTVYQNMAFSLKLARVPADEIDQRVRDVADILELHELLERKPGALSGGQRQRVAMGRAIVRNPEVFLFDEPLSNLDAKLRGQMRAEIKLLHQRLKNTIVYVTHDQVEAMTLADQIVVMRGGIIEQQGTPDEIFHDPANEFVAGFMGSPPMNIADAVVERDAVRLGERTLACRTPSGVAEGDSLRFGMRPDDIRLCDGSTVPGVRSRVVVELVEQLGTEKLVHFKLDSVPVIGKADGRAVIQAGDSVEMAFDTEQAFFFSCDSGGRVR
ncbi:ABC transporter ATP-binding protein [Granulosicoccus sp. 3-233]|uniref:ABC transporter ATP-binding protein n=1 Tax=Granulosicoccus sp. 3-233 TaxID=3417969 RepID=UPI003D3355D6